MDETQPHGRVPAVVERLVKQLYITAKAVRLYPAASQIPKERAAALLAVLSAAQQRLPEIALRFARNGIYHGDDRVFPGQDAYLRFGREFYARNVDQVRFHAGVSFEDVIALLGLLLIEPAELMEAGGFEHRLWDLGVSSITVTEIAAKIVEASAPGGSASETIVWPPTPSQVDEAVAAVASRRPGARRVLVRVVLDPEVLGGYLASSRASKGATPPDALLAGRIAAIANALVEEPPEERVQLVRSLAEAIGALSLSERRAVLMDRLLPMSRQTPGVRAVLAASTPAELASVIASGVASASDEGAREATRAATARALHDLLVLGIFDREEMEREVADALAEAGAGQDYIDSVLDDALPRRVTIETPAREPDPAVASPERVREFVLARTPEQVASHAAVLAALRTEALSGIDDGEVLAALVAVAVQERREDAFERAAAAVEDMFLTLLRSQQFTAAADAADALAEASRDDSRPADQRERLEAILDTLGDREAVTQVAAAVRMYPPESTERRACRRLLERLGNENMDRMLAVLADEQDMVARKALLDALAEAAPGFTGQLARRINDPRWYVVRNVVILLGRTRDPAAFPALAQALRYPEPRVRREVIRALHSNPDPRAEDLIVTALSDDDATNVQVAARLLGAGRYVPAVSALEQVAAGDGRGNRDVPARVEAIEALGRIGAPSSEVVLEQLTRFKGLRSLGRTRELVPVAERALAHLRARRDTPTSGGLG